MTTHVMPPARATGTGLAGTITLALGILFTAAVAFAFPLSLSDAFNPPDWVRVVGLVWLPVGLGRDRARLGVVIALVGLVAFTALVISVG